MKTVTLRVFIAWLFGVALAHCDKVIHGISHSSILLHPPFDQSPKEVIWKRNISEGELQIAKIQKHSMTESLDDRYTLGDNGRDLRIHNVTERDNGGYIAEATMADDTIVNENFCLTVHDPVPPPKITLKVRRNRDQCYITLNCSVPSTTANFSLTWKFRQGDSEYQNISNVGNEIEQTLPLDHQDIEFVCIVQNPADQKNDTVHIKQCSDAEKVKSRSRIPIIASSIVVTAVFGVMLWKSAKKRGQGEAGNENLRPSVQDTESQESPFIPIYLGRI